MRPLIYVFTVYTKHADGEHDGGDHDGYYTRSILIGSMPRYANNWVYGLPRYAFAVYISP